jgi:Domain of unknown function (DUF4349)
MTHPDSDNTATIERHLEAVDDALSSGAAAHQDPFVRELQELGLLLQADTVEPDPAYAERLGRRVEEGFPRRPSWRLPSTWSLPSPRRLLPAGAALMTVLVIGIGLASIDRQQDDDAGMAGGDGGGSMAVPEGGGGEVGPDAARDALAQPDPAESATSSQRSVAPGEPPVDPGTGFAPGRANRKVERSISMTLEAPDEEIPALAQDVTRVTGRHGGYVLTSTLDSDDEGASGFFELRIPAASLRPALADLAGLATVRSQNQSSQDVTRRHVSVQDRLQSARAERRSLLRRLELAETDEEAEAIRRRLDIVAGEINGLRAMLRDLRQRTAFAVVTVDLAGTDESPGGGGAGGSFDDALGDAGDLVVGLAGVLIRVGAIAVPLGLIAGVGWLAARTLRRRRRESVLA